MKAKKSKRVVWALVGAGAALLLGATVWQEVHQREVRAEIEQRRQFEEERARRFEEGTQRILDKANKMKGRER